MRSGGKILRGGKIYHCIPSLLHPISCSLTQFTRISCYQGRNNFYFVKLSMIIQYLPLFHIAGEIQDMAKVRYGLTFGISENRKS